MALGGGGERLSSAEVAVRVHVPESMRLRLHGGQLATGQQMAVFPLGDLEVGPRWKAPEIVAFS